MKVTFSGEIWFWRGPAPWHFVTVPARETQQLHGISPLVSYGWGMVPVTAQIGASRWKTTLTPKDGRYVLPVKAAVRRAERLEVGDTATVQLTVDA